MLPGIARKISLPFILISAAGLILFGVGFVIRNITYKELSDQGSIPALDNAAKPEFFLFWAFAAGGLLMYALSFVYTFWDHTTSKLLFNIFLPVYLLGAGGVLLVNGLLIYRFHQQENTLFYCYDIHHPQAPDIYEEEKYIVIEFTGVVVSLFFFWVYITISSFFASPKKVYV